ncbi:LysR family transcriptional regulator [Oscillospiraceae bacterium MB08-C2-2]|nr:LysR family transcriptional regulator [Oscillospiraceae bacterium MB08-C2-2]
MNTLHFKYAVEVERTRSITQAAENLFMAQPNLSKAIKELEDTIGISIFERTSKGVTPTRKGAEFLVYAKNILAEIERMESLYIPDNCDRQSLNISIPRGSYISSAFTDFIAELDPEKEIDVHLNETNSMQSITNVVDGQFNMGIIRYQIAYENYFLDYLAEKNLSFEPIWKFECLALMSRNHPLASREKVTYKALSQCIEIVHGDTLVPYLSARKTKTPHSSPEIRRKISLYERFSQFDILSRIPTTYIWVSPIPEHILTQYNLIQRKCYGANQKYKDVLIYPKGYVFTELDKRFIHCLYASKNQVEAMEYT